MQQQVHKSLVKSKITSGLDSRMKVLNYAQRNFTTFAYLGKWSTFLSKKWFDHCASDVPLMSAFFKGKMTSNDVSGMSIHILCAKSRYLFSFFLGGMDRTSFPALCWPRRIISSDQGARFRFHFRPLYSIMCRILLQQWLDFSFFPRACLCVFWMFDEGNF